MTRRLYYTDSYLTEFDARIVDTADDGRRVYLDRTAFYPTSGGQPCDAGSLAGIAITDVVDEGERIAHVLAAPLSAERVAGRVDWDRRFDHMQQHSGQHLLSAVLAGLFGYATVSVHFGREVSTLDLSVESLDRERMLAAEARANALVFENRPVGVTFEDAATAEGLRKAPGREGTLRVVTIDGVDRSACGGTHVRATGEIGPIAIRKLDRVRKAARVEFLCGARAVRRARADYDALAQVAHLMSTSVDEVPALVLAQAEQVQQGDALRKKLEGELQTFRARELYDTTTPDAAGVRRAVDQRASGSLDATRGLATAYCALPRSVFIGAVMDPPAILVAASDDAGLDAGRALKAALASVGGRGGGSARMAQGAVPHADKIPALLAALESGLSRVPGE